MKLPLIPFVYLVASPNRSRLLFPLLLLCRFAGVFLASLRILWNLLRFGCRKVPMLVTTCSNFLLRHLYWCLRLKLCYAGPRFSCDILHNFPSLTVILHQAVVEAEALPKILHCLKDPDDLVRCVRKSGIYTCNLCRRFCRGYCRRNLLVLQLRMTRVRAVRYGCVDYHCVIFQKKCSDVRERDGQTYASTGVVCCQCG